MLQLHHNNNRLIDVVVKFVRKCTDGGCHKKKINCILNAYTEFKQIRIIFV